VSAWPCLRFCSHLVSRKSSTPFLFVRPAVGSMPHVRGVDRQRRSPSWDPGGPLDVSRCLRPPARRARPLRSRCGPFRARAALRGAGRHLRIPTISSYDPFRRRPSPRAVILLLVVAMVLWFAGRSSRSTLVFSFVRCVFKHGIMVVPADAVTRCSTTTSAFLGANGSGGRSSPASFFSRSRRAPWNLLDLLKTNPSDSRVGGCACW